MSFSASAPSTSAKRAASAFAILAFRAARFFCFAASTEEAAVTSSSSLIGTTSSSSSFPAESASMADSWPATSGIVAAHFGKGGTSIDTPHLSQVAPSLQPRGRVLDKTRRHPSLLRSESFAWQEAHRSSALERPAAAACHHCEGSSARFIRGEATRALALFFSKSKLLPIRTNTQFTRVYARSCSRVCRLAGYETSEVFKNKTSCLVYKLN